MTELGEIELSEWRQLAQQVIEYHHEQQLQEWLHEWVSGHSYGNDSEAERLQKSLELHMSRIFDNPEWVDYVPFNQEYRPEILEHAELCWVETVCCKKPGLTTVAQVKTAHERGMGVSCPFCGRFSEFSICETP